MQKEVIEFHKFFFYWAIQDWEREVSQGFPFLKNIGETAVQNVIAGLPKKEWKSFFRAMVKRVTSLRVLSELREQTTDQDREYQNKYMEQWRLAGYSDPMYKKIERASQDEINLFDFKRQINDSLSEILKTEYRDVSGYQLWEYQVNFTKWKILTRVEIGNENYQLAYSHSILNNKGELVLEHSSILRWLGISAGTEWYGLTNTDVPQTIKVFCDIIRHFMKEVPRILEND